MDSLMAALVAALLIRATDRSADLAARAARSIGIGAALTSIAVALAVTQGVAAAGGALVAPYLTVNAARLLFACSLLMAGGGALWPNKPAEPQDADPSFAAVTARLIVAGLGDRTMFAIFALAAGGAVALAGAGGFIGGAVVLAAAALAGDKAWRSRLRRAIDWTIGGILMIAGAWLAFSALRLV